eukprot:3235018-Rhodomonas_salina.3
MEFGGGGGKGGGRKGGMALPLQLMMKLTGQSAICLRACYAMPGTDLVYAAISLGECYAMPSTDMAESNAKSDLCSTLCTRIVGYCF